MFSTKIAVNILFTSGLLAKQRKRMHRVRGKTTKDVCDRQMCDKRQMRSGQPQRQKNYLVSLLLGTIQ